MNKAIIKFKVKNTAISLIYLLMVCLFAALVDKIYEGLVFIMTYTLIRCEFTKAVHGSDFTKSAYKGIVYCRLITFAVQIVSLIFIIAVDISKYINLVLAFLLGVINFLSKDYLEHKLHNVVFYKGMKVEDIPKDLKGIEYDIIYQHYVLRYKLDKIAINLNYSVDNIKKLKAKIIKRYS